MLTTLLWRRATLSAAALAFALSLALGGSPAGARPLERTQTDPTAWWWFYGQTPQSLTAIVQKNNARIVDIAAEPGGGPLRFSAVLVSNTGAYAKRWYWWYGQSAADVGTKLAQLNTRLISISPYQDGKQLRFATVMVANDGDDAKQWYWFYGTADYVAQRIKSVGARVVDLEKYTYNGQPGYAAIAIANSGSDAASWWWYFNVPSGSVGTYVNTNNAQLLTFAPDDAQGATADFTMQGCPCDHWWFYYGLDAKHVGQLVNKNSARLTSIRPYSDASGNRLFNVVMVGNS
jgi:hypothetical protein